MNQYKHWQEQWDEIDGASKRNDSQDFQNGFNQGFDIEETLEMGRHDGHEQFVKGLISGVGFVIILWFFFWVSKLTK